MSVPFTVTSIDGSLISTRSVPLGVWKKNTIAAARATMPPNPSSPPPMAMGSHGGNLRAAEVLASVFAGVGFV